MKYFFVFVFALISFVINSQASLVLQDTILHTIRTKLPSSWSMSFNDSLIIFQSSATYWLLDGKCDSIIQPEKLQSLPSYHPKIVFRWEPKWDPDRYYAQFLINDSLGKVLFNLPTTMGIEHLIDRQKSTRFNLVFNPKTREEKELVSKYESKRKILASYVKPLPEFNTSLLSLFLLEKSGMPFGNKCVYPLSVTHEVNQVHILFLEYAKNPMVEK
ncbi:MAG: hypothetical protein N2Z72_08775 [Bacteroidales bacterium]|nr:hypothetical protein [Bacteroidales bacterium]